MRSAPGYPKGDSRGQQKASSRGAGFVRDRNLHAVFELLRAQSPCSCSDLAGYSGLSLPTVGNILARLVDMGLAKRTGVSSSTGGRPPRLFTFNEAYGYVAGIDFTESVVHLGIADLKGQVLGETTGEIGGSSWPMAIVELAASLLARLRESLRIPAKRLLAVGAAAPGITNVDAGIVVAAPTMQGWENVPLGRLLAEKIRVPVVVENNVNAEALGEHWSGLARGERNFVFVHVGTGVGAGLFINGQLHHGPEWSAGEIGYLLVPSSRISPIRKSQIGALEGAIRISAVEHQWKSLANNNGATELEPLCAVEILDRAAQGCPLAQQVVNTISEYLAMVCSHLSLILNCSLIVLGGELGLHPALLKATTARLEEHDFAHPRLAISQLGDRAVLNGALRLALLVVDSNLP